MRRVRTGFEPEPSSARSAERAQSERRTSGKRVRPVSRQPSAVGGGGGGGFIAGGGCREVSPSLRPPDLLPKPKVKTLPPFFFGLRPKPKEKTADGGRNDGAAEGRKKWRQGRNEGVAARREGATRARLPTPSASDEATATATANG